MCWWWGGGITAERKQAQALPCASPPAHTALPRRDTMGQGLSADPEARWGTADRCKTFLSS